VAAFADVGKVWQNELFGPVVTQAGAGIEAKNLLRVGGVNLLHAFGAAQKLSAFGGSEFDFYYRIRAAFPF
jgi:hypothetical protein